ncbi:MAG: Ribosomal RNA small subunit methyltransferase E [candidate division TM6 bacterium GW2011_GWF2_32_72]|nr:MAG: Ribosomal RNA small subunit methyltransferase E [candidate division TM6 bacterium GW2011_GWF2_32_72]
MNKEHNAHIFAIYFKELKALLESSSNGQLSLKDKDLINRITKVLRLQEGEHFILFNREQNVEFVIDKIEKKSLESSIISRQLNQTVEPFVKFLLPILKKEALETALYSLVEIGANEIQLIATEKVARKWGDEKELERLERIAIAAAEQSKNFAYPKILAPISLQQACESLKDYKKIFFEPESESLLKVLTHDKDQKLALLIGPEGDLSDSEKSLVQGQGFIFCKLTPTILRACQAVAVAIGVVRSL